MLRRKGINVHSGIYIKDLREEGGEKVLVADTKDGGPKEFRADTILIAMGRVPYFGGIDLTALGIEHDRRGIKTDDTMQTNVKGIYAIGDVVGKTFLAPVASVEASSLREHLWARISDGLQGHPRVRVLHLGVRFRRIKGVGSQEQGTTSRFRSFSANGRALSIGETDGLVKVVGDADTGKILGVHILGPHADDLIHEAAIAMYANLTAKEVASMIHAHPTLPEAMLEAMHGVSDKPIHLLTR